MTNLTQLSPSKNHRDSITGEELYRPTPDGNPFYKLALAADFSAIDDIGEVKKTFDGKMCELTEVIETSLACVGSITQTAETLHYAALSAGLLQRKAAYRHEIIKSKIPPEQSVANFVLKEFGANEPNGDGDNLLTLDKLTGFAEGTSRQREAAKYKNEEAANIAKEAGDVGLCMENNFAYIGKAMRALAMVSLLNHSSCKFKSRDYSSYLTDYVPTMILIKGALTERYPVIGALCRESLRITTRHSSPRHENTVWLEHTTDSGFNRIFGRKLAELLSLDKMNPIDRARVEEIRAFCFETICAMMFNISASNFPRVLQLVMAVKANLREDKTISEDTLMEITPAECSAMVDRESILTKGVVGMEGIFYRVNDGLKSFADIAQRFNLLSGHLKELVKDVLM